jgi:hypothetical protein
MSRFRFSGTMSNALAPTKTKGYNDALEELRKKPGKEAVNYDGYLYHFATFLVECDYVYSMGLANRKVRFTPEAAAYIAGVKEAFVDIIHPC